MAEHGIFGNNVTWPPAVKHLIVGEELGGRIVAIEGLDGGVYARQYQDADVKTPPKVKTWDKEPWNGKMRSKGEKDDNGIEMVVLIVQTSFRDGPADDGLRSIFLEVKSKKRIEGSRWGAFIKAMEAAGTPLDIKVDGEYYEKILEQEQFGNNPNNYRNIWAARYIPPTARLLRPADSSNGEARQTENRPAYLPATSELPAPDPKATAIAAIKLALAEVSSQEEIGAIYQAYTDKYHDDVWTPEIALMADEAIKRITAQSMRKKNPYLV